MVRDTLRVLHVAVEKPVMTELRLDLLPSLSPDGQGEVI